MRLHMAGSYWHYDEPRRLTCDGRAVDGLCVIDPRREILVRRGLTPERREETTLHEIAHALDWETGESWIQTWSSAAAVLLRLTGCRSRRDPGPRSGGEVMRATLQQTLRLARPALHPDSDWTLSVADEITRALLQLGWRR